jgi:hypothetical protein
MSDTFATGDGYKVRDLGLASRGRMKIDWAESRMPVMMKLRAEHAALQSLAGMRIAGCLHVTKETAVLIETLKAAGAEISWSGCNPLSTQDEVAAALAAAGISIYAWHGMNVEEFYWCIDRTLDFKPSLTLDDGADLIFSVHNRHPELIEGIIGGTEETTTGVHRLRSMAAAGALKYPVIAVNDARPSGTSTTSSAPARAASTASCGPRACCWPARTSWSPASATAAAAAPCGPTAWAPTSSAPRSSPPPPQGDPARLPGAHHGRGRQGRRRLHHRHRLQGRHHPPPLRGDEGRRHRLQHRPLRLRDQPR